MTKWAWEETKKMERSGTEVGKGATDEDRGRGIKEKEEKKRRREADGDRIRLPAFSI